MKKFTIRIVAAIVSIAAAVPASAQLKFGLKVGTAVNSLKFQSDNWEETFSTDNRAGFTGGAMLEFTAPMLGVGFDASVMYMHRSNTLPKEVCFPRKQKRLQRICEPAEMRHLLELRIRC